MNPGVTILSITLNQPIMNNTEQYPDLTEEQINALSDIGDWGNNRVKFGLWDKEKKCFFLTSDTKEACIESLNKMTPLHPRFKYMQLITRPNPRS